MSNEAETAVFLEKGNAHLEAGEFDQAIKNYDQAIALDPEHVGAFYNRGLAYGKKNEFDRAIQDFDRAIALDPEYADAFGGRGVAYIEKGEFDRAIKDFDQAIALDPENANAFYNRGMAYDKQGEFDRAIQDLDQAIELNPEHANAFNNRGVSYSEKGEFDRAIQDFDRAIELGYKDANVFNNRGLSYRKLGKEQEAIKNFKEANELDPTVIPKEQVKKTEERVTEVQNFQSIFKDLRDEYKKGEREWFWASAIVTFVFAIVIFGLLALSCYDLCSSELNSLTIYFLYLFSSAIVFFVARQYTNAKQLRVEASNRLAMAKMFEKIQHTKDNQHYQDFIPKIIDSIAYSMREKQKESIPIDELLKLIDELRKHVKK